MADNVLTVLTRKTPDIIFADGGTQSWVLDRNRAKACKYAVLCYNAHHEKSDASFKHGTAFMIAKIKDVVPSTYKNNRWLVTFSEYALGDFGNQWSGRNPVAYWTTDDYRAPLNGTDLDFEDLVFLAMPEPDQIKDAPSTKAKTGLTIAEAKAGLAETFGVAPSAIEIVIRV